ncbi:hypothetical protein H4Q32_025462 [Labeo rohita]|uniref:Ig-like domain-containing protein n=1 Tax=Labeo rohita TaxID=84645 RepID=A0ABQ8LA37_LABRO|nr:hypothetical protein H4Q32_025462 [Labeo rohita]
MTTYTGINGQTVAGIPEFSAVTTLDGRQIDYYDSEIKKPGKTIQKILTEGEIKKSNAWILSIMTFIIFFIYLPFVYSELHTFMTTYTGINGQTVAGIPEFSAVTTLDGRQIDYYDSVHTYQRMYGCWWDDETEDSNGFDQHGYDGEDFILLDLKELRYITAVQQGLITMVNWNNNTNQLDFLKQYYQHDCVQWLKNFLILRKADSERRAPEVSLLQKDSFSPVSCHATGFYPERATVTWLRNGQDHDEDVDVEGTLPNEDGTFQKTSTLNVPPEEWKKNQYVCVVEHMGKTIQKILTENEIKSNNCRYLIVVFYAFLNALLFIFYISS